MQATSHQILIVRLSSMGDVIHTLPAAASLKRSFPDSRVTWIVRPRWMPLLAGNPYLDEVIPLERSVPASLKLAGQLRARRIDLCIDFQGLLQTALLGFAARPQTLAGFAGDRVRERPAAWFYSKPLPTQAEHAVERNLELAAGAGATHRVHAFPLPQGVPEGRLPAGEFVLASPLAGWSAKQWPAENWSELAKTLDLPLVVNGPPAAESALRQIAGAQVHLSSISGLIDATRRATAVIGVDSGPMHLAAALAKPGVALFGPTDPARHGPYGGSLQVLRDAQAQTSYHRDTNIAASMRAITPEMVRTALHHVLRQSKPA